MNHYAAYLGNQETVDRKETELQRLAVLFDYLEQHYHEPIRVAEAAHVCALSASHFMYFFRKATGQSFLGYLNRFRVAKAQASLVWTEQTLAEISLATGFCDQSHFGQVFRKLVGMTPLNYRHRFSQNGLLIQGDHRAWPRTDHAAGTDGSTASKSSILIGRFHGRNNTISLLPLEVRGMDGGT